MKSINWKQIAVEVIRLILALLAGAEGANINF